MTKMTVDQLVALGGKVWERGEMKRVYFNYEELARFYGLEYDGWKYTVDGEKVSNNSGRQFASALRNGTFWFDLATGEFASKGMSDKMTAKIIERITEKVEAVAVEEERGVAEEVATKRHEWEGVRDAKMAELDTLAAEALEEMPGEADLIQAQITKYRERLETVTPSQWLHYRNYSVEDMISVLFPGL